MNRTSVKMTRSRSQSASSGKSTGSSTSDSSSSASGSSSSSSSGSGSDSSSSDTEASQASKGSRTSQRSRRSNSTTKSKASATSKLSGTVKNKEPIAFPSPSSSSLKRGGNASTFSNLKAGITSGSVKNKNVVKSQTVTKLAQRTFARKKSLAASSSESECNVTTVTRPVKRVGSKPPTVSIITTSKKSGTVTNLNPVKKISSSSSKSASKSTTSAAVNKKASSALVSSTTTTKLANKKKNIFKSIFSENSSEEFEVLPKKKNNSQGNVKALTSSPKKKTSGGSGGGDSSTASATNRNKKSVTSPIQKVVSSSSLSGSATSSNSSSSGSSSDSSSESGKKPKSERNSSPKSPSSPRKRPVTRRRTVKSKTIPTTTTFTQSLVTKSSPQLTHWESDFSASDELETRILTRVPTKTSLKVRPRPTDDEEEMMERRCPFPTCDSSGHLSGKYPSHSMLSTCPKYQGFSPEECKENAEERRSRENERKKAYNIVNPHQKRPTKLSHDAKSWVSKLKDLKDKNTKDGFCSEYDMSLWVDALSVAAGKIEEEQGEGIGYRSVAVGKFEMSCWCESPYPEPLCHSRRLFICEFCLKPVQSGTVLRRHCAKCVWRHPPGDEIYRKDRLSVWEVDGKSQKSYCQNLCLLAKCFLDHKTLYLDVDPFLFYVMTVADSQGCHLVGYFSKEKNSFLNYNVSCILTLPPYQRKGFGRLLIDFSYLLTRVEGKVGSPEKPLSDLGLISYRSYWKDAVLRRMCACATKDMVVKDLSIELGVTSGDLISTLQFLGMLKYWKGKHLVLKKQDVLEEYLERVRRRGETKQIDPACLRWRPFQPPAESSS